MTPREPPPEAHEAQGDAGRLRRERLDAARLYLVLDARPHGRNATEVLEPALEGGVDVVQLREKAADDATILDVARCFRSLCDEHGALLVLNDRLDLVLDCAADGVHLGQGDASVEEARALLGSDAIVGVSTHTPEQVDAARVSLADYIAVGPVHSTPTKPEAVPVGEDLLRYAAEQAGKPFFAIGGIDADSVGAAVAAGTERVAVVRAIRDAADPRAAAMALRRAVAGPAREG